jgi:predicted MFS family arabinose efflux permease
METGPRHAGTIVKESLARVSLDQSSAKSTRWCRHRPTPVILWFQTKAPPHRNNDDDDETKHNTDTILWDDAFRQSVVQPLVVLLLSQFILFLGVGAVLPSIPLYGKEIGLSGAANGLVISAPAVTLLLLANGSGRWADQARKPAMMLGMAVIMVADIGTACAQGLATLVVARLALGVGRSVSEAGERGMLADLVTRVPSWRGRILAAQQAVLALGIAIGAPLGGGIVEQYGPRASFLCVSAAAGVALLLYFLLPETTTNDDDVALAANQRDKEEKKLSWFPLLLSNDTTKNDRATKSSREVVAWSSLLQDNLWKGLALCQCGASCGLAAKIASIPILASAILPGGAIGAGALLSAAGLSGLVGASLGGYITDQSGARVAAVLSGVMSGVALILIPVALTPALISPYVLWIRDVLPMYNVDVLLAAPKLVMIHTSFGDLNGMAATFCGLVILWSTAVSAQGPALTAMAQELAPTGSEATSLALPRAAGDGTYIVAPFVLGLAADAAMDLPGIECAVAGGAALLGAVALGLLGKSVSPNTAEG